MPESEIIKRLQETLSAPDPLQVVRDCVPSLGPWAAWTLPRQIWYLRRKARLTQRELAERSGVTQARVSRIEKGADAKLSTLAAIFAALGHDLLLVPGPVGSRREGLPDWKRER